MSNEYKFVRLTERAHKLLSELSDKRKKEQSLVVSKGGIIAELVMAAHGKEVEQQAEHEPLL